MHIRWKWKWNWNFKIKTKTKPDHTVESRLKCEYSAESKRLHRKNCNFVRYENDKWTRMSKRHIGFDGMWICLSVGRVVWKIHALPFGRTKVWSVSNFHVRRDWKNRFWISTNNTYILWADANIHFSFWALQSLPPPPPPLPLSEFWVLFALKSILIRIIHCHSVDSVQRFTEEGNSAKCIQSIFLSIRQQQHSLCENANVLKWNKLAWNEYH